MIASIRRIAGAACLAAMIAAPSIAHHSFTAEFDPNKKIELTGKVTEMKWANPHAWIYLDVIGKDGKIANWKLETGNANALIRLGWRKEDLPAGTVLKVNGWQARNGSNTGNISTVTLPDGRRLWAGSSNADAPKEEAPPSK